MLKAGIAKEKITPPLGLDLWGYGLYLDRKAMGINDDLYAKGIEFEDGQSKILIISCDLGGLGGHFIKECKEDIAQSIDILKENISICTTHTHSGPATIYLDGFGEIDKKYMCSLKEKITELAKRVDEDREEVKIGAGKGKCEIGFNRVIKDGLKDDELLVLRVDNMNNQTKAIIYNCGVHPVNGGENNYLVSADWPGYTNKRIEEEKNCLSIFLQGSCGEIDVKNARFFEKAKENGANLAQEILEIQGKLKLEGKDMKIKMKTKVINLPLRIPSPEDIEVIVRKYKEMRKNENFEKFVPESRAATIKEINKSSRDLLPTEIQATEKFLQGWRTATIKDINKNPRDLLPTVIQFIQIGNNICLMMHPSELFTKWQLKIKEISPYKNTFIVGFANDYIGYIPDEDDFVRDGYAAFMGPLETGFFHFKNDVGRIFVEEVKPMIE